MTTHAIPRITVRTETFQISFAEPFLAIFLSTLLVLEGLCLWAGAGSEYWLSLAFLPLLTAVLSAIGVAVLIWGYKFSVGPHGIDCYDFWCRPLTTRWDEIREVRRFRLPGLTYLQITVNDRRRALWMPLFVDDFDQLSELVDAYVGEKHPLSRQLRAHCA
jgi:hypothetical protein